jgi:LmbE family N-acetylglucosaminyl deacetylase
LRCGAGSARLAGMAESFERRAGVDIFVPGGGDWRQALARVTHLGIGAHADDLEFMAYAGIRECRGGGGVFGGVVVTDGAGSVGRTGNLVARRRAEQREAAQLAGYAVVIQLGRTSAEARTPGAVAGDLGEILAAARPRLVYTHNPADRHETHVGTVREVIEALRKAEPGRRPHRVFGCEVWRDLDWLTGGDRVRLDCGRDEEFAARLNAVFRSQIDGGKRYDLAVAGRRRAQATFDDPRAADTAAMVTLAMDLTPLVEETDLSLHDFVAAKLDRFREDVLRRLA